MKMVTGILRLAEYIIYAHMRPKICSRYHRTKIPKPPSSISVIPSREDWVALEVVTLHQVSTPESHPSEANDDDYMTTPMPRRNGPISSNLQSSPLSVFRPAHPQLEVEDVRNSIEAMSPDDDSNWDRGIEGESTFEEEWREPAIPKHSSRHVTAHLFDMHHDSSSDPPYEQASGDKRLSIFDWSEQQNANSPRPKTVHGKQGAESRGSRPPGRRGPSGVHLPQPAEPRPSSCVL